MKFGCCTGAANYSELAALGYDYIELSGHEVFNMEEGEWQGLVKRMESSGIPCIGFNDYCHGRPAIVGDGFDPEAALSYAQRLASRGGQAGIKSIGIGAPAARRLPAGYPKGRADEQCRRFLEITAEQAAKHGITVLFEAVHSRLCDYAVLTSEAAEMVRSLQIDNLFMVLDFYHMEVMGENRLDIGPYFPLIRHLHYSSCGEGCSRGYLSLAEQDDLQAIMDKLAELGYQGGFSIEAQTADFRSDAARALEILRRAAAAAGV